MEAPVSDALVFFGITMEPPIRADAEARRAETSCVLGNTTPVHEYEPNTWGPAEADALIATEGLGHPHATGNLTMSAAATSQMERSEQP